jgi:4-diphosphocytidyl-2-C-methyl-D-erythritol kinase
LSIDGDSNQNLIVKAYHLLAKDFELKAVDFYLLKNIPMGAGLGGGSSNAAFTLKMLNEYFKLEISIQKLMEYAAILGSDCTYFIENTPCFAEGRGEVIEPIDLSLKGYFFVLINPNIHVSTSEAFSNVFKRGEQQISLKDLIKNPLENWKNLIENDFEKTVFLNYPEIKNLKEKLYECGAIYASMSGSGSSVFGLFKENIDLKKHFEGNFYFTCAL